MRRAHLGIASNITPYDAWYVTLAKQLGAMLATLDARLSAATGPRCDFAVPPGLQWGWCAEPGSSSTEAVGPPTNVQPGRRISTGSAVGVEAIESPLEPGVRGHQDGDPVEAGAVLAIGPVSHAIGHVPLASRAKSPVPTAGTGVLP